MVSHEGNYRGNGHTAQPEPVPEPGYTQDDGGISVESGVSTCTFNTRLGGRLEHWLWRTVMPAAALNPATRNLPAIQMGLVHPAGGALIDHFLPLGTKPSEIAAGEHREFGDFTDTPYTGQVVDSGGELRVVLLRDGAISAGKRSAEVRMMKSVALRPGAADLAVHYRIINSSLRPIQILFAAEFNLFVPGVYGPGEAANEAYYLIDGERPDDASLTSMGVAPAATHLALANPVGEVALQLGWDRECDVWRMPSGSGGVRLLTVWRLQLPPRDNWSMGLWLAPG